MYDGADPPHQADASLDDAESVDLEVRCRALFVGPLALWAGSLAFTAHPDAVATDALADRGSFDELVNRFAESHPGADRRAVASFWSQNYFARLVIPTTILCLAAGEPLPISFAGARVRFCPRRGTPLCFHFGHGGAAREPETLVKALYEDQVAPAVAWLKRHCGLSARLLWENAGSYGLWILGEIDRTRPDLAPLARRLLGDSGWPRAGCAMLPHMKQAALEARPCVRRVCCLRYRLPGIGRCTGTCPLPEETA